MKRVVIMVLMVLFVFTFISAAGSSKSKVKFLSPGDLYFYGLGATVNVNPYEMYEYSGSESKFSLVLGGGFTIVNFNNRFKINFELEYIRSNYDIYIDYMEDRQKIVFLNFMSNFEYILNNRKTSLFLGIGGASIKYLENMFFYKDTNLFLALSLGFKQKLSKNIAIRGEFKYFLEPAESEYDEYYDEYYTTEDPIAIGTLFAIGLEFRFK